MDALILAGGENKRMPVIKGFLEINGRRIIEINTELLKNMFDRVIISTNNPELFCYLGVLMVGDVMKKRGPMIGILSLLTNPDISEIFVTACDMPYLNPVLIKHIINKYDDKWGAVVPLFDGKPQPLLSIYSRRSVDRMEACIKKGKRSLREFLRTINVLYIQEKEVRRIDPEGRSFVNINTIKEYQSLT